jgi:hypothetical protein
MFVGDQVRLDISYAAARERLLRLGENGALFGASDEAYGTASDGAYGTASDGAYGTASDGAYGTGRVGVAGVSKLVRVQARELAWADNSAGLALRWEATGPGSGLFPVLDADLTISPAPGPGSGSVLKLAGVYRPPLGLVGQALDRAVLHRVAMATVRRFLAQVVAQLADEPARNGADGADGPEGSGSSDTRT